MEGFQLEPKLAAQVPKPSLVGSPVTEEVFGAIQTLLKHSPPPSVRALVAEHLNRAQASRVHCVYPCGHVTSMVKFGAVFGRGLPFLASVRFKLRKKKECLLKIRVQVPKSHEKLQLYLYQPFHSYVINVKFPLQRHH